MAVKRLYHTFYYSGYAGDMPYDGFSANYKGFGPVEVWMRGMQIDLSNTLTQDGWNLVSITPLERSEGFTENIRTGTDAFLVVVDKYLPEELVDQIVEIRTKIYEETYKVLREEVKTIEKTKPPQYQWRDKVYTQAELTIAKREEALKIRSNLAESYKLYELCKTLPTST